MKTENISASLGEEGAGEEGRRISVCNREATKRKRVVLLCIPSGKVCEKRKKEGNSP